MLCTLPFHSVYNRKQQCQNWWKSKLNFFSISGSALPAPSGHNLMQFACFSWMDNDSWKLFCSKIDEAYRTSISLHSTSRNCIFWCIFCFPCIWTPIMVGGIILQVDYLPMLDPYFPIMLGAMIGSAVLFFLILICWSHKIETVNIGETHNALANVCSEQTALFPGLLFIAKKQQYFLPSSSPDNHGGYAWRHYIQVQRMPSDSSRRQAWDFVAHWFRRIK